jgi:hypothetical protein
MIFRILLVFLLDLTKNVHIINFNQDIVYDLIKDKSY